MITSDDDNKRTQIVIILVPGNLMINRKIKRCNTQLMRNQRQTIWDRVEDQVLESSQCLRSECDIIIMIMIIIIIIIVLVIVIAIMAFDLKRRG